MNTATLQAIQNSDSGAVPANKRRSNALALRLEEGARSLADLAATLSDAEWQTPIPHDGRKIGVVVHHVGNMYPLEIKFAQILAAGNPIEGVTWETIDGVNATHAKENADVTKAEALAFLRRNAADAAAAVRAFTDRELDQAAPVSLNDGAPLTCQFFVEDHALRHSFHHIAKIRAALKK
jgi:hypothetical protein